MSYILDALKKSERARGSQKTRELLKDVEIHSTFSQPSGIARRWPFLIALLLLLNAGIFAFWLHPWQRVGNTNGPHDSTSNVQSAETRQQSAPVTTSQGPAQVTAKKRAPESMPGAKEKSSANPTKAQEAKQNLKTEPPTAENAPAAEPPTGQATSSGEEKSAPNPSQVQEAKQNLKTEPSPAEKAPATKPPPAQATSLGNDVAAKNPDGSKLPQNTKAAGPKKDLKTANPDTAPKNPPEPSPVEQPRRQAATSGIISDIQPLTELGPPPGKPEAQGVQKWHELSAQIRDAIPGLSVSMLIYSEKPEERWININGSKKREGEMISAGLKVDEITPDGAIFSYQGHRFYKGVVGD
jgi:general secretion pathway protein B